MTPAVTSIGPKETTASVSDASVAAILTCNVPPDHPVQSVFWCPDPVIKLRDFPGHHQSIDLNEPRQAQYNRMHQLGHING